jgi:predicted Holliday junction resolvase-like endonuclease
MIEKEIVIASIISVCIIICIISFIYFRRKMISMSADMMTAYEQDLAFISKVEEIKKELVTEYQSKIEKDKTVLKQYFIDDAFRRSKNITKGRIAGHLAPFLGNNCLKPSEVVFLGSPIDMISFSGIESKEDIVLDFIEVKTGNSSLNKKQKLIRNAINAGRVYYRVVNLESN